MVIVIMTKTTIKVPWPTRARNKSANTNGKNASSWGLHHLEQQKSNQEIIYY